MNEDEMISAKPMSNTINVKSKLNKQKKVTRSDPTKHSHRTLDKRTAWYSPGCYACIAEDRARGVIPDDQLNNTIFLYPGFENAATGDLCVKWLGERYPGIHLSKGDSFPLRAVASNEDLQIVCVRPVADVGTLPLPVERVHKDPATNKLLSTAVHKDERLAQICASAPIRVDETCFMTNGSYGEIMISGEWNYDELVARICEAFIGYRVYLPVRSSDLKADDRDGKLSVGAQ